VGSCGILDNSMAYNGCLVEGTVKDSILFPGVRVEKGAEVNGSVLFFNTIVQEGGRLDHVISDVNTTFGPNVRIGGTCTAGPDRVTVIGWNNHVPDNMVIGSGCTVAPGISAEKWPQQGLKNLEKLQ